MAPLVSIIIPTYNRAHYLAQSIESAVAQTYGNLEIIVADDASTDDTSTVVSRFNHHPNVRYHRFPSNVGMTTNWRICLTQHVHGDWFLVLGDDDYLIDPTFIESAVKASTASMDIRMVCAPGFVLYEQLGRYATQLLPYPEYVDGAEIFKLRGSVARPYEFIFAGVLFHAQTARALNAFANGDDIFSDGDLYFRIALKHDVAVLQSPVCVYRVHGANTLTSQLSFRRLVAGFENCLALWRLMSEDPRFTSQERARWKRRVLIRYCRGFLVAGCLDRSSPDSLGNVMHTIFSQPEISRREIFCSAFFLARLAVAQHRTLYLAIIGFLNKVKILSSSRPTGGGSGFSKFTATPSS